MVELAQEIEKLDPKRRALLDRLLAAERGAAPEAPIPRRPDGAAPVPLSAGQERLWFLDQLAPGNPAYNMPAAFRLEGPLAPAALHRALREIVRRHEVLRTTFAMAGDEPRQIVAPRLEPALPLIDLAALPAERRRGAAAELAGRAARAPFDLGRGPLLRASLLRLSAAEHVLLLAVHHAVADGWSMGVLFRELEVLYAGAELPELPLQYGDFALWQRRRLAGPRHAELAASWKRRLAGAPPVLDLPADRPRPPVRSYRGRTESLAFPGGLGEELRQVGRCGGATLFMTLLAAFAALLGRWSGGEDVVVGTPVAGRDRKELEPLIGLFLSTLPLRTDLSGNPSFAELLGRVRAATLEAFGHGEIPFERLLEELGVERSLSHSPLFQCLFVLQNAPGAPLRLAGLGAAPLALPSESAKLDLQLVLEEEGAAGLRGWLEYSSDLFDAGTVRRLAGHLRTFLAAVAGDAGGVETPVWELPLLSAAERSELLAGWNGTARPYDLGLCLHQWIEGQARRTPEAAAVAFEGEALRYRELDVRADRLARRLRALGIGVEDRVAVCAERSLEMVVALLAILKAGAAYVPLDPEYPRDRLAYMLEDSRSAALLIQERLAGRLDAGGVPTLCLDADREVENVGEIGGVEAAGAVSPEQAAYVIYTSGSTGRPKGVAVSHRGICNRLLWMQEAYGLDAGDRVLQKTPFSFDVSVWELFWPLMTGACLVMARPGGHRDGAYLVDAIAREGITTLHFVPSMLQVFLDEPDLDRCRSLRRVMCSGEALPKALQDRFFERLGGGLHNLYGPTEASVDVTFWACERESARPEVPIGRPIANTGIHLLDRHLGLVPVGVPGELHIGGVGLARGYAGRPDLTAERFIPDPFSAAPGGRLYRTGDLCRRQADGAVDYLGRLDHQVKVRGFRIELGEIETALRGCPGIREAVVMARRDTPGEARLAAYLVADAARRPAVDDLRAALLQSLPEHMVPAAFVFLEAMPLSANGKADRKALPAPDLARPELAAEYVAPRTHAEEVLAAVWSRVLGVEPIGVDDNFFALGGDSIRGLRVLALARERGLELTLQQLFQHQTLAALAPRAGRPAVGAAEARRTEPLSLVSGDDRAKLPEGVEDAYPLTQLQAGMLFHSELAPGSAVYHDVFSLRLRAPFDAGLLAEALRRLAVRHPVLRTSFDLGRYGEPLQLVHADARIPLAVVDLAALDGGEQETALDGWIAAEKARDFDAGRAPLLRYAVHLRGAGELQLTLSFHHAILDGWSVASLTTELLRLYDDLLAGGAVASAPAPPPLATAFRDYVALELAALRSPDDESYWRERLRGGARTVLPRWPRPAPPAGGGRRVLRHPVAVGEAVSAGLARLARQAAVPLKSVLLAAHLRVLALLAGQGQALTGLVANGRPEASDGDRVLGLFLNVLPCRLGLPGGTWLELVQAAFAAESEALPHRRYPMVRLQRALGGEPLFETSFNFVHFHVYEGVRGLSGVEVTDVRFDEETNFPLVVNFSLDAAAGRAVRLALSYDPAEIGGEQVELMGQWFLRVLEAMGADPGARYDTAALQPPGEASRLAAWNATAADYDLERPLHAWIAAQAARTPEAVAVRAEGLDLTYRELLARAGELAGHLRGLGVGPESRVAICAERSPEMVVGLLATLEAGAAYVPLDPSYPAERLAYMLADSRAAVLLTQERLEASLPASEAPVVRLDAGAWPAGTRRDLPAAVAPENLAYVIYTSGSTGRPKGAMVPHRGIVNRLLWKQEAYGLSPADRVLQKTPFSFDVSVWEFFWPLMTGARLVMARPEGHKDPAYLAEVIQAEGITTLHFVPSMLRVFLDEPAAARCRGLERVLCSGEALPPALVERFHALLPDVELHNLYGPTEASVDVTAWPCAGDPAGLVPIGRPIANLEIRVLDGGGVPAPVGSPGELHIAGAGLGRGYLGRPELTAEKFVPDPWGAPGSRLYATGDLARWLPDGALEYLGRIDHQVKIRGFRIELGEIEAALGQHPGVAEAVVVARPLGEDHRLIAYFAARGGEGPAFPDLRAFLAARLPDHMIPALFYRLDALPLSPNGKVDRRALPEPGGERPEMARPYEPPRTAAEQELAAIWRQSLGVDRVGLHDDFFALGGDSILSLRLLAVARERGFHFSLQQLFTLRTVHELARAAAPAAGSQDVLARLDELSDDAVDSLLAELLGAGPSNFGGNS